MKRIATLLFGLFMIASTSGCYCWSPWHGGWGGYQGGGGQCGSCGIQSGPVIDQGAYYGSYSSVQAGLPVAPATTAYYPPLYTAPQTAVAPLQSLPTYD